MHMERKTGSEIWRRAGLRVCLCAQANGEETAATNLLTRSAEVQTEMQEGNTDTQTEIDELTALLTQLRDDKTTLTAELCQLRSQQTDGEELRKQPTDQQTSGTDTAAKHPDETRKGLSAKTKKELSAMSAQIGELKSTIAVQETRLCRSDDEKRGLQRQLDETMVDLQSTEADCRQLEDTVADLKQQLATMTHAVEESKDREDDLQKAVEASQAELRQSECKWHEVVDKKEQLVLELRSDLDALTGSVQRREHMWDSARQSMEQEIEAMRLNLSQQTAEHDNKVQVMQLCYL